MIEGVSLVGIWNSPAFPPASAIGDISSDVRVLRSGRVPAYAASIYKPTSVHHKRVCFQDCFSFASSSQRTPYLTLPNYGLQRGRNYDTKIEDALAGLDDVRREVARHFVSPDCVN